ncbi:MAG TPA: hypothetical protein VIG46_08525 [Candidatus Baltobacteraceae bacterium]
MRRIVALAFVLAVGLALAPTRSVAGEPSYADAKRAAALVLRSRLAKEDLGGSNSPDAYYSLTQCEPPEFTSGGAAPRTAFYADLAGGVFYWEYELPRIGYPERVWRPWVSSYEASIVATARRVPASVDPFNIWEKSPQSKFDGLRRVLTAYREKHPRLPEIITGPEGCGGGEVPVKLITQPTATRVVIIPSFFYELCRVRRIDPNDTARCAHWREVSGPIVQVSGDYHYIAKWRDGTVKRGMLDIESAALPGGDDPNANTITLRKP